MRATRKAKLALAAGALSLVAAACGSSSKGGAADGPTTTAKAAGGTATTAAGGKLTEVKLQLQWFIQAQFAGYLAAVDQGYYKAEGLDVKILEGGVDIVPQKVLADGQADFALAWVPKALASREAGANIVDIAQDRKSTRLNSSHLRLSRMPSSA